MNNAIVFLDLVGRIAGKGWHGYGPVKEGLDSLLYVSFHVNPNNSQAFWELINSALSQDYENFWFITRGSKPNRIYLCSSELKTKADELGSYEEALNNYLDSDTLGIKTSKKLALLTKLISELSISKERN
ncbi:hypothetical protein [Alkalimarinus sediminis]|uniref:Uncharacterized protein n=3 Tax=Alkalimarinus sediminis TaxID=1632866 RepID=A0A9E8KRQ2_9ALTE|nr:hypothetical protein [Alkalimarinus sediminis]UZW76372.1 hypothetical protein NNL22_07235 [Alkalimarinus sediminis]